ncbi:MAG: LysE family translocator [Thermodesulfobacteriota bacterium]
MIHFLIIGIVLGLSAGCSPGPLLTLVISETLRHDIASGIRVAVAPLVTDLPIILLTLFISAQLVNFHAILGFISLAGGFFVLRLGVAGIRSKGTELQIVQEKKPASLTKGIVANALSPHPYLFWLSVGAPTMASAMKVDGMAPLAFIGGFYVFLVGSKMVLAILVGKSKMFLSGKVYRYTLRFLGLLLCGFAVVLLHEGLTFLGMAWKAT